MAFKNPSEQIIARSIRSEDDFWLVRDLLIETWPITPPDFNWDLRRWDGSHFYNEEPGWDARWAKLENYGVRLWGTEDGRLVGAVNSEYARGDAFLQIHPDYRHIEEEMIEWAEEHLALPPEGSDQRQLVIFIYEYDLPRRRLLEKRGYEKLQSGGVIRRMRFGAREVPQAPIAEGYVLREVNPDDIEECRKIADVLNAAFRRNIHTALEYQAFAQTSPSFNRHLELVAVAPDGTFAAYVGMIYDEVNHYGLFEPVCTHPDHVRKGLASTLMFEGMRLVRAMGATEVNVATGDQEAANKLYESVGFPEVYKGYNWRKLL
jgi:mycothiol synthase